MLLAPFTLTVNEVGKGETVIALKDGEAFVQLADLEAAGILNLPKLPQQEIEGIQFVPLKALSPPLKCVLDEREIALSITAPVSMLPASTFDVSSRPAQVDYQSPTSMFLNYSLRASKDGNYEAYEEMVVSHGGDLLSTTMQISSASKPRRGTTSYTINERSKLRRLVLGDAAVSTGVLGGAAQVGGWTVSRAFDLDPYTVTQPSLKYMGETMTPASLDVYVNGQRVRSLDLAPGRFELNNLRASLGAGAATYVLRDVFGKEYVVENPFYVSDLLAKDLDDFAYSIGIQRLNANESWSYERPVLLGAHRYGLTEYLTVGGRAEAAETMLSGGASATLATLLGELNFAAGGSVERGAGGGWATTLGYGYLSPKLSVGARGTVTSDHYATLSVGADTDRTTRDVSVSASAPIVSWASVGSSARYGIDRDGSRAWGTGVNCNVNYFRSFPIVLLGSLDDRDGQRLWRVALNVTMSLGSRHMATAGLEASSEEPVLYLDMTKNSEGPGFAYRAGTDLRRDRQQFDGFVQYEAPVGRYSANYSHVVGEGGFGSVDASGAVVLVPGVGLFATLPIADSFGVVSMPGVKGVRVMLNNLEVGRTNSRGNALVPGLVSYYGNRLGLKLEDVPMTYDVKRSEEVVAPPQRGAAIAVFPSVQPHYMRGSFVVQARGRQIIPEYGQARVLEHDGQEVIVPLGEKGEFELENVEPGVHPITIEYLSGTCKFELSVPDTKETVTELGVQVCHQP